MGLRHFVCSAGVCALMGLVVSGQSFAQAPSGTAVAVVQSANARGPGGARVLEPQKPVYTGDRINTGSIGEAQIRFRDETRLVVGPNSSLLIDRFVYNEDRTAREVGINFAKGAFRFISGNTASQAYSIRTPNATLAIRGTMFDLAVPPNLPSTETHIVFHEGSGEVCLRRGRRADSGSTVISPAADLPRDEDCRIVEGPCATIIVRDDGFVESEQAQEASVKMFQPYISEANYRLEEDFQASKQAIAACLPVIPNFGPLLVPLIVFPVIIIVGDDPTPTHRD